MQLKKVKRFTRLNRGKIEEHFFNTAEMCRELKLDRQIIDYILKKGYTDEKEIRPNSATRETFRILVEKGYLVKEE